MQLITIVLGFVSLIGGAQLPWMFTGSAGYLVGVWLADVLGFNQNEWQVLTVASAVGLSAIFVTYYLRRLVIVITGFLAGGYISTTLPAIMGWKTVLEDWQGVLLVGTACAVILILWYKLALVLVTSLAGATLVVQHLSLAMVSKEALFVVLIVIGLTAQYVMLQYAAQPEEE